MSQDTWNAEQYERFETERSAPFADLMNLIERRPQMRILDLGCGTGKLSAELHRQLEASQTLGIDSSPAMLQHAKTLTAPGLTFCEANIADYNEQGFDLIFSHAALHWLGDHDALLQRFYGMLKPGGQLAIQIPANDDYPTHQVSADLAREAQFKNALDGYVQGYGTLDPARYAQRLAGLGFKEQHVRLEVYGHWLESRDDVFEWVRGSHLSDYEKRLPAPLFDRFLKSYRGRLVNALPDKKPFFFPFKRILLWAKRDTDAH